MRPPPAVAVIAAVALGGCSPGGAPAPDSTGSAEVSLVPIDVGTEPAGTGAIRIGTIDTEGECPDGSWIVTHVTFTTPTEAVPFSIDTDLSGTTLEIGEDAWTLNASQSPLPVDDDGTEVVLTIDGTVTGTMRSGGERADVDVARGSVVVGADNDDRPFGFDTLVAALAPDGGFDVSCEDGATALRSEAATLTIEKPAPAPTVASDPALPTVTANADGVLVIRTSPPSGTVQCAGRPVEIRGTGISVTIEGSCPTLTVTGSANSVMIGQVGTISADGTANVIQYGTGPGGTDPVVDDTGNGNQIGAVP